MADKKRTEHAVGQASFLFPLTRVSPDELLLDPANPRLAGQNLSLDEQSKILAVLWKERVVNEVVDSIAANGYWQHEVLFAAKESGKLVVIEGNRRLAAVKLLCSAELCQTIGAKGVPVLTQAEQKAKGLNELPYYEVARRQIWDFVGFKHVNGPQDWDSIAKAQYVARVHNEFKVPLEEIASKIGDRHDTVKRLYRGLMVLARIIRPGHEKGSFPCSKWLRSRSFEGVESSTTTREGKLPCAKIASWPSATQVWGARSCKRTSRGAC